MDLSTLDDQPRGDANTGESVGLAPQHEKVEEEIRRRQAAEAALRESEESFRHVVDSITDYSIFLISPHGEVLTWNKGARRMFGYPGAEIIGRNYRVLFIPEDFASGLPEREIADAEREGRAEREGLRVHKDGSRFWANEIITSLCDASGQIVGFTKVVRDLTARKRMEDALRESEQRYRRLVENVREYAIFMLDEHGVLSTWNLGVERVFEYTEDEWIGQPGAIIFTAEDKARGEVEKEVGNALAHGQAPDERWHVRKDGSRFWATGILTTLYAPDGKFVGFSKVLRDNTERKQAQEELEAAHAELEQRVIERTAELSTTVSLLEKEIAERQELEIALLNAIDAERRRFGQDLHDGLCQHLFGTALLARTLANRLDAHAGEEAQEVRAVSDLIIEAGEHARALAKGLHPVAIREGGLSAALNDLARLSSASVRCRFDEEAPVQCPAAACLQLYRIAQEAVTNALKHARAGEIVIRLSSTDGNLILSVSDNGRGFDARVAANGMGLRNLAYRARVIGASLSIESEAGRGSCLTCRVPLARLSELDA